MVKGLKFEISPLSSHRNLPFGRFWYIIQLKEGAVIDIERDLSYNFVEKLRTFSKHLQIIIHQKLNKRQNMI